MSVTFFLPNEIMQKYPEGDREIYEFNVCNANANFLLNIVSPNGSKEFGHLSSDDIYIMAQELLQSVLSDRVLRWHSDEQLIHYASRLFALAYEARINNCAVQYG